MNEETDGGRRGEGEKKEREEHETIEDRGSKKLSSFLFFSLFFRLSLRLVYEYIYLCICVHFVRLLLFFVSVMKRTVASLLQKEGGLNEKKNNVRRRSL